MGAHVIKVAKKALIAKQIREFVERQRGLETTGDEVTVLAASLALPTMQDDRWMLPSQMRRR